MGRSELITWKKAFSAFSSMFWQMGLRSWEAMLVYSWILAQSPTPGCENSLPSCGGCIVLRPANST
jgi:hypothetical protein